MPSFADIANKKANTVEKPPLVPIGNYVFEVTNEPSIQKRSSANGEFEIIDFLTQGLQAMQDVDTQELAKFGGAKGVRVKHSFIFNTSPDEEANFRRTEYELTQFLVEHLKAGPATDSLGQLLGKAKGKRFQAEVGHRPDKEKKDVFYPEIKNTMPVG